MAETLDTLVDQAVGRLKQSSRAVALTGAGISTRSGIPDFRSPTAGLWAEHDPMIAASIDTFKRRPQDFYRWFHPLAGKILQAKPNPAHIALADLEAKGPLQAVITQNIDMLHSHAGSKNIYEMHGHLRNATCVGCGYVFDAEDILTEFVATGAVPNCEICGQVLKPNVTLYGETPPEFVLRSAEVWSATCDLMLVVGSSLEVVPAADFPLLARQNGARLIIINFSETYADQFADVVIHADAADVLPRIAAPFLSY